jgi:hypothetical protein
LLNLFRRRGNNDPSNTVIGIILLIMLLVFMGPNVIPELLSRSAPFIDEGAPCARLRTAQNRAAHQSLIGRSAQNPLSLRVEVGALPTTAEQTLRVSIVITNNTIGTVPLVFDEEQVIVGDDGSSGVGILFEPALALNVGRVRRTGGLTTFPEEWIHLLGPRQRCVTTLEIPGSQLLGNTALQTGNVRVRAYYRVTSAGVAQGSPAIFPDQGLAIIPGGYLESSPIPLPAPAIAAAG